MNTRFYCRLLLAFCFIIASSGKAQDTVWLGPGNEPLDWFDAANWSSGAPVDFSSAEIGGDGVAILNSGVANGSRLQLGTASPGRLEQIGGQLNLDFALQLGGEGGNGEYLLRDGELSTYRFYVGSGLAGGTAIMEGGTIELGKSIQISAVTDLSPAIFYQHGGTIESSNPLERTDLRIDSFGAYEMTGGRLHVDEITVHQGRIHQSGGEIDINGTLQLVALEGKGASFMMDDGLLRADSLLLLPFDDVPTEMQFIQNGGHVEMRRVSVSGGDYRIRNNGTLHAESLVAGGDAVFQMEGTNVQVQVRSIYGQLKLYDNANLETGFLELNGGHIESSHVSARSITFETGSLAIQNGTIDVGSQLIFGNRREPLLTATMDFQGHTSRLSLGYGSQIDLAPTARIVGAENTVLRIGADSVVRTNGELLGQFASIESNGFISFQEGEPLRIAENQRARLGSLFRISRMEVDGFAYGSSGLQGTLRVGPKGQLQLAASNAPFAIRDSVDSGVFGGTVILRNLEINGSRVPSIFTVASGDISVIEKLSVEQGNTLRQFGGQLNAKEISLGGLFQLTGGETNVEKMRLAGSPSRGIIAAGNLSATEFELTANALFEQDGGVVDIERFTVSNEATYRLTSGQLRVRGSILNNRGRGIIDLANSNGEVFISESFVDLTLGIPFVNAGQAKLSVDEHSLIAVPAAMDPNSLFGTTQHHGFTYQVGAAPLLIPEGRELRAAGDMAAVPMDIYGNVVATEGQSIKLSRSTIHATSHVDLGDHGVVVADTISPMSVHGGTLRTDVIELRSAFQQIGGEVNVNRLYLSEPYEMAGGKLVINDLFSQGRIDFQESNAVMEFGAGAVFELWQTEVTGASDTTLSMGLGSVIRIAADQQPSSIFQTFETQGYVHTVGSNLVIPAEGELLVNGYNVLGDSLVNHGKIKPSKNWAARFEGQHFSQSANGNVTLRILDDKDANDQLSFQSLSLDGRLEVELAAGVVPGFSSAYALWFGQTQGEFQDVDLPKIFPYMRWDLIVEPNRGLLQIVPRTAHDDIPLGDLNEDGQLNAPDLDLLATGTVSGEYLMYLDLNGDRFLDAEDRRLWVEEIFETTFGDSNLDGVFSSADLVAVFQFGHYEDNITGNSSWASGDWNGDLDFDSSDLVLAFQRGNYEVADQMATVPEPHASLLFVAFVAVVSRFRHRRC